MRTKKQTKNAVAFTLVELFAMFALAFTACSDGSSDGNGDGNGGTGGSGGTIEFVDGVPSLGATGPGGGKIFYHSAGGFTVYQNATDTVGVTCHYLEAAPNDIASKIPWASIEFTLTNITGTGTEIGTGRKNTVLILATDVNAPAAKACNVYTNNGKTDWFLPSKDELNQLYINRTHVGNLQTTNYANGAVFPCVYWSSSQDSYDMGDACYQNFSNGSQSRGYKTYAVATSVRAVRAF